MSWTELLLAISPIILSLLIFYLILGLTKNFKNITTMKIIDKVKKCCVWNWCLYSLKRNDKKWEYAVISKTWEIWTIEWSVAIWIDENKNIALIKNYRHAIDKISWELPRWGAEKWISSIDNAVKEFQEEIWIKDVPLFKKSLLAVSPDWGILWNYIDIVLLKYEDFSKYNVWWEKDGSCEDIYEINYFSLEKIEKMVLDGDIIDNFTISAYGLLKLNRVI